jgi:hypothetical protein
VLPPPFQAKREELRKLDAYRDVRDDAVVIVNLIRPGSTEEQDADRAYIATHARGMAEGAQGPMHMGRRRHGRRRQPLRAIRGRLLPGIDHMHAMVGSTFMDRIVRGKQLGDSLALATNPVLAKL